MPNVSQAQTQLGRKAYGTKWKTTKHGTNDPRLWRHLRGLLWGLETKQNLLVQDASIGIFVRHQHQYLQMKCHSKPQFDWKSQVFQYFASFGIFNHFCHLKHLWKKGPQAGRGSCKVLLASMSCGNAAPCTLPCRCLRIG